MELTKAELRALISAKATDIQKSAADSGQRPEDLTKDAERLLVFCKELEKK